MIGFILTIFFWGIVIVKVIEWVTADPKREKEVTEALKKGFRNSIM